ncbi:MAG TPA: ribonucleoside triphosphate reductase [Armatimonadetes bacterium]|nr:ribonucleoside triphosphate reductase [Armatimonadota bacterium]
MDLDPTLGVREVIKRDGQRVPFDPSRIELAILKAGNASGEFGRGEAAELTERVLKVIRHRSWSDSPSVEQIQDIVEQVLIEADHFVTARKYIVYREQRKRVRDDQRVLIDAVSSVNEYLEEADWRVHANANQGYSLGGLILNVAGKVTANYWLSEVYPAEVGQAHRRGDLHIHDLDMLSGYCAGWSLRDLLYQGFNGVPGKVEAAPAKRLSSAVGQMVNFLGTLQNEWAGAQAFSSFDTYLAPFVRADHLRYGDVKQCIQEFVYNLNVPSRWGTQTPFTNITLDWTCPEDLRNQHPRLGDEEVSFTYGDLDHEMAMINQAFLEVMTIGDWRGRVFTFPIPTYNITHDFDWDHPNTNRLFEMTAKYGIPYFQNFLNSDLEPHMVRSMCCRLQLDLHELLKRGNGLFGSAEQTGSVGVVTLNCARMGYLAKGDLYALYQRIDDLLEIASESLELKRKTVQRCIDNGLLPYTQRYLGKLRNHFSTIGVNGIHECIANFTGGEHDITDEWGRQFAIDLLNHIRERLVAVQEETGHLYNLEATPAESATYRFAREDRKRWADIIQSGPESAPYYTNSSQLPVGWTEDPFGALEHQEELQRLYTGGTVFHMYMPERISSAEACKQLVRRTLERFRIPYLTITPTFSICPRHGYLAGEQEFCPKCDAERLAEKRSGGAQVSAK